MDDGRNDYAQIRYFLNVPKMKNPGGVLDLSLGGGGGGGCRPDLETLILFMIFKKFVKIMEN